MKKFVITILSLFCLISTAFAGWDLLEEDCSDISDWIDDDDGNGVSEVDPTGQLRLDTNAGAAGNDWASRTIDVGSFPNTFTVEIKLYHDSIGLNADIDYFVLNAMQTDERLTAKFSSDGLFIKDTDSGDTEVGTDLVKHGGSAEWQIWRFLVTFTGTTGEGTCDVYLTDSTHSWEKVGTAIPCSFEIAGTDGTTMVRQNGYATNDMVTHVDYVKIMTGLYSTSTRTISDAGGNWNDTATWEEGIVPTSSDDVVAQGDGSSGNLTINVDADCKSADFTNYTGTLTHNDGISWTISGNLTFVIGMTYIAEDDNSSITVDATASITTAGKNLGDFTVNGSGITVTLQDTYTARSDGDIVLTEGTLDFNDQDVTIQAFNSDNTNTRTLNMGSGTITCTIDGSGANAWDTENVSNFTLNCETSTLIFSGRNPYVRGGGKTYYDVQYTGGTNNARLFQANTFTNLSFTGTAAKTDNFIQYQPQT